MAKTRNVLIMGAAGRDFHNFNVCFRGNSEERVVAFTAFQIPNISGRTYPPALAGDLYPEGIPIFDEAELARLIDDLSVDEVVFAYSDVAHEQVMHRASLVNACGADFRLMGAKSTMIKSAKPVISVGAIRTGCGKSQTSRRVAELLHARGKSVVVIRHPMPYGDLEEQACQRFATLADLDRYDCTIEEREEYEGHINKGFVVYAGVDYGRILAEAEKEADIILWDGGNNDIPFYEPDLHIVLVDPLRPGHEYRYYPGETNLRLADVVLMSKIGSADRESIQKVRESVHRLNPTARLIEADSVVTVQDAEKIRGKRVLVVEDGPTLTHGGMATGAGFAAAKSAGVAEIIDPRQSATPEIAALFAQYPHIGPVLPAVGYNPAQRAALAATIARSDAALVIIGTPFDLARIIPFDKPSLRARYELSDMDSPGLAAALDDRLRELGLS